jgi:hypothetical protein
MELVLNMRAMTLMPRQLLALVAALGLLLAIPVPSAIAHDYCVKQGYDWGCVTNDHARWSACDAEKDGQRVYSEAWHRTPQGYYTIQTLWDPDGAGGKCGVSVTGRIDKLKVCETGPSGTFCEFGP